MGRQEVIPLTEALESNILDTLGSDEYEAARLKREAEKDRTGTGQDDNVIVTVKGHDNNATMAPSGHHKRTGQEQDNIRTGTGQYQDTEVTLAKNQLKIYDWFLKRGLHGAFNKPLIEKETGVAYATIRKVMVKLENLELIRLTYDRCSKEYEYIVNPEVKVKRPNLGQEQDSIRTGTGQEQDIINISSCSYTEKNNNNARARDGAEYFDGILSNDPEFLFWKKRGLTYKQICTWCEMADCDPGDMIEYLRYYRWDIVEEKLVEKKKIDDIFAWFSGVMKKSGTYRRPDKYKTWVEKDMARRAAEERRRMEERKEVIRLYGENMLAEPDTALYAKCHEMASTAMKRPDRIGGPGYRSEMIGRLEQFIDAHGFAEADRLRAIKIEKEEP